MDLFLRTHYAMLSTAALLLTLPVAARAQDSNAPPDSPDGTPTLTGASSTTGMPSATDSAPGQNSGSGPRHTSSLVNYYFVFLALILVVAAIGVFFIWRRRKRALAMMRTSRESALQRDLAAWGGADPGRSGRWYRHGRWGRSDEDLEREEGLNELGEAPPAYAPKSPDERPAEHDGGPTVPLQTLSREGAGLKPPDYSEANAQPVDQAARRSTASAASSSRHQEDNHRRSGEVPSS